MNKTQIQFLRLGDYISNKYAVKVGEVLKLDENYNFARKDNAYVFRFYKIGIWVDGDGFTIDLPKHIDICKFDSKKILADMWRPAYQGSMFIRIDANMDEFNKAMIQLVEQLRTAFPNPFIVKEKEDK